MKPWSGPGPRRTVALLDIGDDVRAWRGRRASCEIHTADYIPPILNAATISVQTFSTRGYQCSNVQYQRLLDCCVLDVRGRTSTATSNGKSSRYGNPATVWASQALSHVRDSRSQALAFFLALDLAGTTWHDLRCLSSNVFPKSHRRWILGTLPFPPSSQHSLRSWPPQFPARI